MMVYLPDFKVPWKTREHLFMYKLDR